MPIADVKPVASSNWMVTPGVCPVPSRSFSAGFPLSRHPPAANFLRLFRILEIQDHGDVSDVTFHGRGNVGVAAVKSESMNAFPMSFVKSDFPRFRLVRYIENFESGLKLLFCLVAFVVDEHHVAADANFMRMETLWYFKLRDQLGVFGIFDVDDRSAIGRVHMTHVRVAVFNDHRTPSGQIHAADLFDLVTYANRWGSIRCHSLSSLGLCSQAALARIY